MYYQGEIEKKDRRKIIAIATAIVAVVLILVVSIIVVATRKSGGENVGGADNASFAIDGTEETTESTDSTENSEGQVEESTSETEEAQPTVAVSSIKPAPVAESASSIPSTGPEDVLPMALALGSLTTAGTAYVMSRKN